MKILITTDWYAPIINGVVTSVLNLKREFEEQGHEVRILTLAIDKEAHKENNIYYLKSFDLGKIYPNARAALFYKDRLVKELIAWQPDIVHSQCEFMTYIYAVKIAKKCNCPMIHTYHTVYEDYTHYFSPSKTMGKKMVALWSSNLLRKADTVVVPTEKVEHILESYHVKTPVTVIPTGIDLRKYAKKITLEEKQMRKQELGIPLENKVIVSVGRLAKEKNIEELLQYVKKMKRKGLTLLLVGDGPYRQKLEEEVDSLELREQVVFTGMVPSEEVGIYFQLGDIFVSASQSETQGLTYIEALASGIPALCHKDECLEHVLMDGYNGFQYETYEYFHTHLEYMLENEERRQVMAEQAIHIAGEYSTWTFGSSMMNLYQQVIKRRKSMTAVSNSYFYSRRNVCIK